MHVQGLGNRCEGISWTGFITGIRSAGKRIMGKRDGYRRKQLGFKKCMNVTKEDIRGGGARRGTQQFRDTWDWEGRRRSGVLGECQGCKGGISRVQRKGDQRCKGGKRSGVQGRARSG